MDLDKLQFTDCVRTLKKSINVLIILRSSFKKSILCIYVILIIYSVITKLIMAQYLLVFAFSTVPIPTTLLFIVCDKQ
jgi:hypothetical protein